MTRDLTQKFQDFTTPPVLPECEIVEKQKSTTECPPLQMFSSEIVSHYGITQVAPTADTESEMDDEVTRVCIKSALHVKIEINKNTRM